MARRLLGWISLTCLIILGIDLVSYRPTEPNQVKSIDTYWAETGLSSKDLEELINNQSCASSLRYFLACVNSVSSILYRQDRILTRAGEQLISEPLPTTVEMTERQLLEPWRKFYLSNPAMARNIDFQNFTLNLLNQSGESRASIIAAGLNGFLSIFKDPHTYIIPLNYFHQVVAKSSPRTRSLGVIVSKSADHFFIRKVLPGSPADVAGLKKGDYVIAINKTRIEDLTFLKVNEMLRSDIPTLTLTILRKDVGFQIQIQRHEAEYPSVSFEILKTSRPVGVLSINKFSKGTCSETERALFEMIQQEVDGVILDIRDNSGGQIEEASCIAGLFLGPKRKLFELHFFDMTRPIESIYSEKEAVYTGALAILINRGSASASELLAGSLRDYGRALLVGEKSFGKGSFQEGEIWKQNPKVALFSTKGFYILPSGHSPQMYGLKPDIEVKFMNDVQPREFEQYIYALHPPSGQSFSISKVLALNACGGQDKSADDNQLSTAAQALFCIQPVAEVADREESL